MDTAEKLFRIKELRKQAALRGEPVLREKSFDLLLETVKRFNPFRVLEIGVNEGLTSEAILVTVPGARVTGIEISEEKAAAAKKNYAAFGVNDRAKVFIGDAAEVLPMLTGEYDFVFLDGPKGHYAEYLEYIEQVLVKGGVLFCDNVLYRGYLSGEKKVPHKHATIKHSLEKFTARVTDEKIFYTKIYDIEDGVSVSVKLV